MHRLWQHDERIRLASPVEQASGACGWLWVVWGGAACGCCRLGAVQGRRARQGVAPPSLALRLPCTLPLTPNVTTSQLRAVAARRGAGAPPAGPGAGQAAQPGRGAAHGGEGSSEGGGAAALADSCACFELHQTQSARRSLPAPAAPALQACAASPLPRTDPCPAAALPPRQGPAAAAAPPPPAPDTKATPYVMSTEELRRKNKQARGVAAVGVGCSRGGSGCAWLHRSWSSLRASCKTSPVPPAATPAPSAGL